MRAWPVSRGDVEGLLGVAPATDGDGAQLELAADAASRWVVRNVLGGVEPVEVDADIKLGATLLAARWYGRRSSINGVASFGEFGATYVMRQDPDVASLLGLGRPGVA